MSKRHIHIGVEESGRAYDRFIDAWRRAERGELSAPEIHLNFENLSMLLSLLTPRRLEILKTLRHDGPLSVRALSNALERDYKNVHTDIRALEEAGLVGRMEDGTLAAPWDVIDAHLNLVA